MAPTVAHLNHIWLPYTQTFVYSYVARACRYRPVVYAEVYLENPAFDVDCTYLITRSQAEGLREAQPKALGRFYETLDYPTCFEAQCEKDDVDVLHAHFGFNGEAAISLQEKTGLPLVTSFYGVDASHYLDRPAAFRKLFGVGDLFLALGDRMAERLVSAGCPKDRLRIQPLSIDLEVFAAPDRRPARHRRRILFCGRLVPKKGLATLFDAFDRLDPDLDVELCVVGDGPLRAWCEERVAGESERVHLAGRQSHEAVRDLMQDADLFVLPSETADDGDAEGTPTVLLEAQAMALPVVSTDHADIPSIVDHGRTGLLVPERDPESLAEAISTLVADPGRRDRMGVEGRRHVARNHDIRRNVTRLEAHYDGVR